MKSYRVCSLTMLAINIINGQWDKRRLNVVNHLNIVQENLCQAKLSAFVLSITKVNECKL